MSKSSYRILSRLCPDRYFPYLIKKTKDDYREKRKGNNIDSMEEINGEEQFDISMLQDDWESIKSDKMLRMARKYDLIIPSGTNENESSYWSESYYGANYLNSLGRNYIKKQLREEQKWKRDVIALALTTAIGMIGGLIGLLSIILKK